VELQGRYEELKRRGLGLAAISYDSPATLRKFSEARGITFPLIADAGSAIIKQYGLFNTTVERGTRAYGVPYPGTFMLDRKGIVRARHFEDAYQERNTAASILVRQGATPFGPVVSAETRHLLVTAAVSDPEAVPGKRLSIAFDIEPRTHMHVYAPGKHAYQVISVAIDPQPWLRTAPLTYPGSEIYHFKPLDERVEVYLKPFRLVQDVTILATPEVQKLLANQQSVTISGQVKYQACDDKICYSPQSVPLKWTLPLRQLVR
jgi:AhpC/TSA family/Thiol:disulfide interchange protein DsbD, N-terminal